MLTAVPDAFFRRVCAEDLGTDLPEAGLFGVGNVFLPTDEAARQHCKQTIERFITEQGQQLIGGTKLNSAVTVPQSASGGPVALLPANGDTVFVLDSYRGSVFPFGEMVATKVSLMSEAEFGSFVRDWDWSDGDRLLSAGSSCTGRLASCAVQCEKLGSEYRTRRVEQTARCVPVSDPRATCWSTYRVQCRESWYTDAACTQVSAKAPAHFYSNSCDP